MCRPRLGTHSNLLFDSSSDGCKAWKNCVAIELLTPAIPDRIRDGPPDDLEVQMQSVASLNIADLFSERCDLHNLYEYTAPWPNSQSVSHCCQSEITNQLDNWPETGLCFFFLSGFDYQQVAAVAIIPAAVYSTYPSTASEQVI